MTDSVRQAICRPGRHACDLSTSSHGLIRLSLRLLAAIAVIFSVFSSAAAAEEPSITAIFGWNGQIPSERWSPLTVYIHSPERSISGTMLIEYAQDAYQRAQIATPFAAVAAQTSAMQSVICLPPMCDFVRITLLDERDRHLATGTFAAVASGRNGPIGTMRAYSDGLLVCVGVPRLAEAMRTLSSADPQVSPQDARRRSSGRSSQEPSRWSSVAAVNVRPGELPLAPMAYDGAMALVVDSDAAMEVSRAALEAVHQWVLSGGRLVILAPGPGERWRAWLPVSAAGYLEMGDVEIGPVPGAIREAIAKVEARPAEEISGAQAAEMLPRRLVHVTDAGRRHGWKVDLQDGEGGALLAEGPAGFGYVTVLGFDPYRTTRTLSAHAAAAAWVRSIDTIASEFFESTSVPQPQYGYWYYSSRSQQAINAGLRPLANVPVLGYATFLLIALSVVLLALLVGPVDYFVLRRRQALQRSWLTALVWIAVASGLAIAAPRIIRTDPTLVNRLSVVDQFATDAHQSRPYATGLTGIYAGHAGTARLTDVDPASWWRGTSSVEYYHQSTAGAAQTPTVQEAASGEHGWMRSNVLRVLPISQWTFRTFLDQSAKGLPGSSLSASITGEPEDGVVCVAGLPAGSRVAMALLRIGDRSYWIDTSRGEVSEEGAWEAPYPHATKVQDGLPREWDFQIDGNTPPYSGTSGAGESVRPGALLALPGPDRRALAIESRLKAGSWAVLYLQLENCPPYPKLSWEAEASHTAVVRLLIPIGTGDQP